MKVKVLQPMPEKGKLFDFKKKNKIGLKSTTTYDASNDYAVIISGGYDDENNWFRYWNDCSAIYSALVDVYNYSPSHIYVIISDGTSSGNDRVLSVEPDGQGGFNYTRDSSPLDLDGNGTNDIQYSATKSNISSVFNTLSNILNEDDHLFVYTTDHGGQTSGNDVYLYLWGETMTDDEFAVELDKVDAGKITITMEQCHSGGFIDDISADGRIISTACLAAEESHALANLTYNEYIYHWTSAISGETPEGTTVDADYNNDGWVSMREAFDYAENADTQPNETPQYNSTPGALGCFVRLSDNWNWNLSSSSLICDNGSFLVNDVPTGATITWEDCSNTLTAPSNSHSNPGVFTKNSNGNGWVEASINNACGSLTLSRQTVWVGAPVISSIDGPQGTPNNHWAYYSAQLESSLSAPTDYNWTLSPLNGNYVYEHGDNGVNVNCDILFSNTGNYQLVVQAKNTCSAPNFGPYCVRGIYVYNSYYMMISPNPTTGETVLEIKSDSEEENVNTEAVWDLEIYSPGQLLTKKVTKLRGNSTTIQTHGWKEGVYVVRVRFSPDGKNEEILTGKLVVKE